MAESILEVKDVIYQYPDGTRALNNISISLEKGKKIAFLGSNGAGKTTLFLHLNGVLRPAKGKIICAGQEVTYSRASLKELRKSIGIVFQDPEIQLFSASVFQEVSFGPMNMGLSKEEVRERVEDALAVTEITDLQNKPTHYLSYGQKKRVSIADIVAMGPQVIVFDEPTSGLDPRLTAQVMALFAKLSAEGKTIILSTHDVDAAYSWADSIVVMNKGQVVGEGLPEEIFSNEELLQEAHLARPWLLDVYWKMQEKGLVKKGPAPRTREALYDLIGQV